VDSAPEPVAKFTLLANMATSRIVWGERMKSLSAREAKYGFGRLIDLARAEPVTVAKHGRAVVVVMAVEEYERLTAPQSTTRSRGVTCQSNSQ
jgi:prevent-host-death family protein